MGVNSGGAHFNVKHNGKVLMEGNTYLSDNSGSRYTLSLEDTRREADSGEVDFHKLRGLDGIYIANKIARGNKGVTNAIKKYFIPS